LENPKLHTERKIQYENEDFHEPGLYSGDTVRQAKLLGETMEDFEKLGQFYLGRRHNLASNSIEEALVMYDSKDLVTHGVCVGMTGSGKTGLCLSILEEAAIDKIPALVIDPKGDMGNLLLTFPNLSAAEFLPWINADDATRANQTTEQYAAAQAEIWKNGLAQWGQDGKRIAGLRESSDFTIYTPGSSSGVPISVLNSFACPAASVMEDREAAADLISSAVTGLLGLIGVTGDPMNSREHILISSIIQHHWTKGQDLDIAALVRSVQTPPFERIGAFDTDSYFPAKDRFALALSLNNLLAAPGFGAWLEGDPLDIGRLMHTAEGKPRMSIISIAHLSDPERMFFVTLLLNRVVSWMRTQPGTTSLRALIYMDEVAGYLPPVANPPSKKPLMLLFKQARAFGVGVLLATQNPVDLDYKALSNAGTWFIGHLQTSQDIDRLVQGLSAGSETDPDLKKTLASLGKRVFLMKNIHEDAPEIFQTRWCLSYLRGPLTLSQIKTLSSGKRRIEPLPVETPDQSAVESPGAQSAGVRPGLPPQVPEFFLPFRGTQAAGATPVYKPMIYCSGEVQYPGSQIQRRAVLAEFNETTTAINWEESQPASFDEAQLEKAPPESVKFEQLSAVACKPENYKLWARDYSNFLYRTSQTDLYRSPEFNLKSNPGESESDFRVRISQLAREKRDNTSDSLRRKYAPKLAVLEDRIRRAEQRVEKEKSDVKQAGFQTAVSLGATLLGAFMGRKVISAGTICRASSTMRSGMKTVKERSDIAGASENLEALHSQRADLESEFNAEIEVLGGSADPKLQKIETIALRPKKTDVNVRLVSLVWIPK
jgi:hypothetical protein